MRTFTFGLQTITTRVRMMVPTDAGVDRVDVTGALENGGVGRADAAIDAIVDGPFFPRVAEEGA